MNNFQLMALSISDLQKLRHDATEAIRQKLRDSAPERRAAKCRKRALKKNKPPSVRVETRHPEAHAHNMAGVQAVPARNKMSPFGLEAVFPYLIEQDWSDTYPCRGGEPKYYVYAHVDPSKHVFNTREDCGGNWGGRPFYIGKGTGSRAFDLKRNQGHGKRLSALLSEGFVPTDIVRIIWDGLTEQQAYCIEAKCIYFFGTIYEPGKAGKRGALLNLDIPKTPVFNGVMKHPGVIEGSDK